MIMKTLEWLAYKFSNWLEIIAGLALISVMLLTGCDIVGRVFKMPIPGTFELVSFAGGLVIGLAVPITSRTKGHVIVDLLLERVSPRTKSVLTITTRLMGMALFLLMGCAFLKMGSHICASGEVSSVLNFPFYPVAYAMGGAFFVEALVLVVDMVKAGEVKNG
jgi:TRAP-type C4-dicarboxylate transport system permease small subunit